MVGRQRIDRVRREYNQWAANQTLEDFALRFTAKRARRWSPAKVGQTAFGAVSFLAMEAIGGSITLNYGFTNAFAAILVVGAVIFATALPICYYAARFGVDIDLLTRGAGFGYIGSTLTSLIYASFTFLFFAIESVILSMALELCLGIPLAVGYLCSALAVVPLVTFGISAISRFQVWTQPLWIALNVLPIAAILWHQPQALAQWRDFAASGGDHGFHLLAFGSAASVAIALIVQVGEQVDFLRFLPERSARPVGWWVALLSAGPGWILPGTLKLLAGSFLAVYLVAHGVEHAAAADPPRMYLQAFSSLFGANGFTLALTCAFVVLCQLKINVTNAYAGSIAWSNFFSRLTHSHPGRVVWLVFNVAVALLVMELGVYRALEQTLAFYSSVAVAWVGALVADLVINKPLGFSPPGIEFKRAHLYDINPVGTGSMGLATAIAIAAQLGTFGPLAKALAPFLALVVALVCSPLIAWGTKGRYYLARTPEPLGTNGASIQCCICENAFEPEDMAGCPAYAGPICSLCCSLDARCHDLCKPHGRMHDQLAAALARALPARSVRPHLVEFILAFSLSIVLVAVVLVLIGLQIGANPHIDPSELRSTMWKVLASLVIVVGVVSWLFVLVQVSRRAAQDETLRQTERLFDEIEAHERTDAALKRAKEVAEAANFAKSRYVVGLSHELRTPLNTIMGYAQLLERDKALPTKPRGQIAVMRRSANHLSGLIDGLLDISKIEAGKLDLARDEISTATFLTQITDMFSVQASAKGIAFETTIAPELPAVVATDEKRLRQIIINLLSNAIKFTREGRVTLTVRYRNQVADFLVEDTGPGIAAEDIDRIFDPFERLQASATEPGTGLGLTICRLLAGVMGGDIVVTSELGKGTTFKLRLFLPQIIDPRQQAVSAIPVDGRLGLGRTILLVDDDAGHRGMILETLEPYGFRVVQATTAAEGLEMAAAERPDLMLLDIELPDSNGWRVAEGLREQGHGNAKIVMLSAGAMEEYRSGFAGDFHDAFVYKPVDITRLVHVIATLLELDRQAERAGPREASPRPADLETLKRPPAAQIAALIRHGEIGHLRGLRDTLAAIAAADPACEPFVEHMTTFVDDVNLRGLMAALERLHEPQQ